MFRKLIMATAVLALPLVLWQTAPAAENLPPAGTLIPKDAIVTLEISNPKALIEVVLQPKVTKALTALPAYKKAAAGKEFRQVLQLVRLLETMFDTDWQSGLKKLTGGGITLAVCPNDSVLLIVDAEDARMLQRIHEVFLNIARGEAEKKGQPGKVLSAEYRGVTGWTFNGKEAHAVIGRRLLVANRVEALKAALDRRAEPGGNTLDQSPAYKAAKKAARPDTVATAAVNMGLLKMHPPIEQVLSQDTNPLVSLLFSNILESLSESNWISLGLEAKGDTLSLLATLDDQSGGPSKRSAFAVPAKAEEGTLPNLIVPRRIAGLSLYRDLNAFYSAKDELFPERTSGLIFFENMMGIFFSGRDLTDEVMGAATPDIRLVVARQQYDPAVGTPQIQAPAVAVVIGLREPKEFAVVAEEAWQKAVGLVNFTRGQKALPGLIIDRSTHADTKFTVGYFSSAGEDTKTMLPVRYNLRPSLAVVGDSLIISSTDGLTKDLIDALGKQKAEPVAQTDSILEMDGSQLATILQANRDNLVRQNMVEKGNTQQQAETDIDLLVMAIKYLGQAKLDLARIDGHARASLQLKLNLSAAE